MNHIIAKIQRQKMFVVAGLDTVPLHDATRAWSIKLVLFKFLKAAQPGAFFAVSTLQCLKLSNTYARCFIIDSCKYLLPDINGTHLKEKFLCIAVSVSFAPNPPLPGLVSAQLLCYLFSIRLRCLTKWQPFLACS